MMASATNSIREFEQNGETFIELDASTTLVKAKSELGIWYAITRWNLNPYACTCPSFEHRGRCRHVEALKGKQKPACDWCGTPTCAIKVNDLRLCMKCSAKADDGGLAKGFVR